MRIENIQQVSEIYSGKKKVQSVGTVKASETDQLQISQAGRDYQLAKQAVANCSDVREDVVKNVKDQLDNGTYEVSGNDFASKVIEKYNQLML